LGEQHIKEFGSIAKESNTLIIPFILTDVIGVLSELTD
jgi:hypothetical protein